MKRTLSFVLACALLLGAVLLLASCGKTLSGEYTLDGYVGSKTYAFDGKSVAITYEISGFEKTIEGTYEITENEEGEKRITITLDKEDEEDASAKVYAGEFSFSEGEEDGVKYIKIGGAKYTKVNK